MVTQAGTNTLRRPGIYFQEKTEANRFSLPPLDVAAFVGFAQRGPVDTPVALEDIDTYHAIFGGDLAVARKSDGTIRYASLPTAVAGFFANGGRRCYVVRVAGPQAAPSRFCAPGLVAFAPTGNGRCQAERCTVAAAWPGRWSSTLGLATQLRVLPLPPADRLAEPGYLTWPNGSAPLPIERGDLLRLTFAESQPHYLVTVAPVVDAPVAAMSNEEAGAAQRFQLLQQRRCFYTAAALWTALGEGSPPAATDENIGVIEQIVHITCQAQQTLLDGGALFAGPSGEGFGLFLAGQPMSIPPVQVGDLLQLTITAPVSPAVRLTLLLPVEAMRTEVSLTSPPEQGSQIYAGALLEQEPTLTLPTVLPPSQVERLRFDLLVQETTQPARTSGQTAPAAGQQRIIVTDLGFDPTHPRFWGNMIFLESSRLVQLPVNTERATQAATRYRAMQQATRNPQIEEGPPDPVALAGQLAPLSPNGQIYLPLGMGPFFDAAQAAPTALPRPLVMGDDDLAQTYGTALFVDRDLVPDPAAQSGTAATLAQQAIDRYAIQQQRLRGMHSLFPLDEVALIAVPDAIHVAWTDAPVLEPDEEPEPEPPPPPDRSRFQPCAVVVTSPLAEAPTQDENEGREPAQRNSDSAESNLPILAAAEESARIVNFTGVYATLLELHHALINLGQARRDWVAILTLPEHFGLRHCREWSTALRSRLGLPTRAGGYQGPGNLADLSYAAVYHPWLLTANAVGDTGGQLRTIPPDGAVCGVIAARALARGVWVAPANVPLQNVLGLQPPLADAEWAELFALGFNLVRPEPRDFRMMSAHTLSDEGEWLQLSVRRLLILLRKVAFAQGMAYVFENNDERLRNAVALLFGRLLQGLFERGALAGATPQQAYRIVLDNRINGPADRDNGRFFVDIQVAPAQPLEFITVRLLRNTDGDLQLVEL